MTDLTEQWKKGELPEGHYYVKDGENMIAEYLDGYFYNDGNPMTSFNGGVDEVLAPVPSYEEYQQLKEYERTVTSYNMKPIDYDIACETVNKLLDDNKRLKHDVGNRLKEIEKLKELLIKCCVKFETYAEEDETCGLEEENKYAKIMISEINEVLK